MRPGAADRPARGQPPRAGAGPAGRRHAGASRAGPPAASTARTWAHAAPVCFAALLAGGTGCASCRRWRRQLAPGPRLRSHHAAGGGRPAPVNSTAPPTTTRAGPSARWAGAAGVSSASPRWRPAARARCARRSRPAGRGRWCSRSGVSSTWPALLDLRQPFVTVAGQTAPSPRHHADPRRAERGHARRHRAAPARAPGRLGPRRAAAATTTACPPGRRAPRDRRPLQLQLGHRREPVDQRPAL
jgi:hypothetical protein